MYRLVNCISINTIHEDYILTCYNVIYQPKVCEGVVTNFKIAGFEFGDKIRYEDALS